MVGPASTRRRQLKNRSAVSGTIRGRHAVKVSRLVGDQPGYGKFPIRAIGKLVNDIRIPAGGGWGQLKNRSTAVKGSWLTAIRRILWAKLRCAVKVARPSPK